MIADKIKNARTILYQFSGRLRQRCYIKTENPSQYHRCPQSV